MRHGPSGCDQVGEAAGGVVAGQGNQDVDGEQGRKPHHSEFRYGSLTRSVRLPAKVDAKDVKASYQKGILEVSVPVPQGKPEGTRITIEKAG